MWKTKVDTSLHTIMPLTIALGRHFTLIKSLSMGFTYNFGKTIDDHLLQIFINVEYDICIIWIERVFFSFKK
jgi:hypothetical protein